MAVKKKRKAQSLRDMVRAELSAAIGGFRAEVAELTEAAQELNTKLFDLGVNQGNIRDALRQSETALQVSAELRAEWGEAKMLSKVFEQRQFLRSPEVQEARRLIAKVHDLKSIGAGAATGPDLPGKTLGRRAKGLLTKVETVPVSANNSAGVGPVDPVTFCQGYVFELLDGDPCANCRQSRGRHREKR